MLGAIADQSTRNLVRGIISGPRSANDQRQHINTLRRSASLDDLATSTEIILGRLGAFPLANSRRTYRDLLRPHGLEKVETHREIQFLAGRLNGWRAEVIEIVGALGTLAKLPEVPGDDALSALRVFAERWGASNVLAKKIAYVSSTSTVDIAAPFDALAAIVDHKSYSNPYFAALESISLDFPYFYTISTRIQALRRYIDGDFRKVLPLHNVSPLPLSYDDIGAIIRRSHSMSLVDEVVCAIQIGYYKEPYADVSASLLEQLSEDIRAAFERHRNAMFRTNLLFQDEEPLQADLAYYQRSLAFLEFKEPFEFRDYVDRTVAPRLLSNIITVPKIQHGAGALAPNDMTKSLFGFRNPGDFRKIQNCGTFLRTVQFLYYLDNEDRINLTQAQIRYIFEHTTALDSLLSERELEKIFSISNNDSRSIVSVLALALYRARDHNDDIDYKFRYNLSNTIAQSFGGSVGAFVEYLIKDSPQIANYLVNILDQATLQKMYWVVKSVDEADIVRQRILRAVGSSLGKLDYFVEADAVEAQRQVSKLRQYFDDSRMYVDGIAMKRWLVENPSAYAQQYTRLVEHLIDTAPSAVLTITSRGSAVVEIAVLTQHDYILRELAKIAFREFCTNANFGIESYLGRRIRHNTMSGMMRSEVDTLIEKPQFSGLRIDYEIRKSLIQWDIEYRQLIDDIRVNYLQFRSNNKPHGLFSAEIDLSDPVTATNLTSLRKAAWTAGGGLELLNELLIRFCWRQIDPQLVTAAKMIEGSLFKRATDLLDRHFSKFTSDRERQFASEMHAVLQERFIRLASWFRQPNNGFVQARIRQLGDIIALEASDATRHYAEPLNWIGDGVDMTIDGLSVHRMYDCLSVLLRNAFHYGDPARGVMVSAIVSSGQDANVAHVRVSVSSYFCDDNVELQTARLRMAFSESDLSAAMEREGYSGIKKLRFILRQSETTPNSGFEVSLEGRCDVYFEMSVEQAHIRDS